MRERIWQALTFLVVLVLPLAIALTAVRLLLSPLFLHIEYRMPYFPRDPYGFTQQERLYWAEKARSFLLNSENIDFLARLHFPDGRPVFDQRELRHMVDVKRVVQGALLVWYATLAFLLGAAVAFWQRQRWAQFRRAVHRGAWLTIYAMAGLLVVVLLAFGPFFVFFHRLFFEGDTWLFPYSATLIRLFPERFWVDAFAVAAVVSAVIGFVLAWWGHREPRQEPDERP
ncbi:MAG: TIGR01906 family membrane protein [Chloroflexi bacterium]|nr:TIGR01906 family membrane protein [Chloroflexota bacterium]